MAVDGDVEECIRAEYDRLTVEQWSGVANVVRAAVDGLPRRQRDVVCLYYFLDLDVAKVADLLGVSNGTVKTAVSRARARLAVELVEQELEA